MVKPGIAYYWENHLKNKDKIESKRHNKETWVDWRENGEG